MKTITFLRHAQPWSNGQLSDSGKLQSKSRAAILPNKNFDLLITSNTARTLETGLCILNELNLVIPHQIINEINIPELNNMKNYYMIAKHRLLQEIMRADAKNILVISHSDVINNLGLSFESTATILSQTAFGYTEGFIINFEKKPASVLLIKNIP